MLKRARHFKIVFSFRADCVCQSRPQEVPLKIPLEITIISFFLFKDFFKKLFVRERVSTSGEWRGAPGRGTG